MVSADRSSVTIEDHTKPRQKGGALPIITYSFANYSIESGALLIGVGDTVEIVIRKVEQ